MYFNILLLVLIFLLQMLAILKIAMSTIDQPTPLLQKRIMQMLPIIARSLMP